MGVIKKAVLLSGGIDSICLTYALKPDIAYTIDYGQIPAQREILVSQRVCEILGIKHEVIQVDCSSLGSGTLIGKEEVAESPSEEWWPFRNQLLVTLASMKAIQDGVKELYLGSVKSDSFHKDGTPKFYKRINHLTRYQEGGIKVLCFTNRYYSHELAQKNKVPRELLLLAHSCHRSNVACGECSGCIKHIRVRQELNIE